MAEKLFPRARKPPVPPGTPEEIGDAITWDLRPPETRHDVGVPFVLPELAETPPHRLVVLGGQE